MIQQMLAVWFLVPLPFLNPPWTFRSDKISHSVVSDSLWPHESQHARPPCPSPTPGIHSDSCPSSQLCHPAISSSGVPFSSCPQSLPASESFPMSQLCVIPFIYPESPGQSLSIHSLHLSELQFQPPSITSLFLLDLTVYLLRASSAGRLPLLLLLESCGRQNYKSHKISDPV